MIAIPFNNHIAEELKQLADPCEFQTVKAYFRNPGTEITQVVLVQEGYRLHKVAAFYAEPETRDVEGTLFTMLSAGVIRYGVDSMDAVKPACRNFAVLLDSIPDTQPCHVIYLPPAYIVKLNTNKPGYTTQILQDRHRQA